jgi:glycosyltransferase involved in cell wall biosynthesis
VDLLIGMKFPVYYAPHHNKVIWLIHQHRQAYDLWNTEFGDIHHWKHGAYVRNTIIASDRRFLSEARRIFTISQNVSDRLLRYNGLPSAPLYSPPLSYEKLHCAAYERFIFYPSRIDAMKRQRELIEAARYMTSDLRILIAGMGASEQVRPLQEAMRTHGLESRVKLLGYVTAEEKIDLFSRCLAVYFGGYDEDYGYVTLEAMFSKKPVITHPDSGGALEFVRSGENGYVVECDARALAECLDGLAASSGSARKLGEEGLNTMREKKVSWDHVIDSILEVSCV